MRIILRSDFKNGTFGDPALYIWEMNGKRALLFDCGDLNEFSTRQLLKVSHIFLSHCHMDHFFGFDHYLRVHVSSDKVTTVFGPPETSKHVGGKLQGYTWNLIHDQNLEFIVIDLDSDHRKKHTTRFHAKNRFSPSVKLIEPWNPSDAIYNSGTYHVHAATLDHRTPSMAYSIEEIESESNLNSHCQHKIAYATDGAAHQENRKILLKLIQNADLFFSETCFLQADEMLANETKHFTAQFIGTLAQDAKVKKLAPFHFSKRYLDKPSRVTKEIATHFHGEIISLRRKEKDVAA